MLKTKVLLSITILGFSVSSFGAYFPDLFGAAMRGAEQARQDNARDAYYYQQVNQARSYQQASQPEILVGVYDGRSGKLKRNVDLSSKRQDVLCWTISAIPQGTTYYPIQIFTMPVKQDLQAMTFDVHGHDINTVPMNPMLFTTLPNSIGFQSKVTENNNEIGVCRRFNPQTAVKGGYTITVVLGKVSFGTYRFNIVD